KDGKVVYKKGQALNTFAHMTDDGKTAGGCWIYTGVMVEGPDGKLVNKANARKPADEKDYLGHGWAFSWPANRRILYNRASADLEGKPWSEQQNNPVAKIWSLPDHKNDLAPLGSKDFPYVITTYRLTEHHLSGVMSRYLPMLAEMFESHFAEISQELAKEIGVANGDKVTVST